jgi:hypothetical protein
MLHNFSALAPINHLDRITYARNCQESRKRAFCVLSGAKDLSYAISRNSNAALLLPHLFPVSAPFASRSAPRDPLLRYSYKKIGVGGQRTLPPDGFDRDAALPIRNSQCFLSLTHQPRNVSKIPQCFLSLTDQLTRNYQCFLSLTKKWGVGGSYGFIDRAHPIMSVGRPICQ